MAILLLKKKCRESVTQVQEDPGTSDISPQIQNDINTGAPQQGVVEQQVVEQEVVPETPPQRQGVFGQGGIFDRAKAGPDMTISMPQNVERSTWIEETPLGKNFVTDFFGDIIRAWDKGSVQGASIDDTFKLIREGKDISDEDLNNI